MHNNLVGIDFFCGCGGMTAGLIRAGVEVRLGVDMDAACGETYEKNNKVPFECSDIRKASQQRITEAIGDRRERFILFAACAPCQPFSKARKSGVKRHPDTNLLLHFLRLVLLFKPEFIICENVPELSMAPAGLRVVKGFVSRLLAEGYAADTKVVNAADFAVPQNRRRLVILATRLADRIIFPEGPTRCNRPTVRQAIADLPPIDAGCRFRDVPNHWASALSIENLARIRATRRNGGDLRSVPPELRPPSRRDFRKYGQGGFFDVYGRMKWDEPAPTLTTRCNSLSNGRYGHPEQDRAISLREAARLQTFPDSYVFHVDSIREGARIIGNAVPVNLAYYLGASLIGSAGPWQQVPRSPSPVAHE